MRREGEEEGEAFKVWILVSIFVYVKICMDI